MKSLSFKISTVVSQIFTAAIIAVFSRPIAAYDTRQFQFGAKFSF